MATPAQIAAARRNIKKAQEARRRMALARRARLIAGPIPGDRRRLRALIV